MKSMFFASFCRPGEPVAAEFVWQCGECKTLRSYLDLVDALRAKNPSVLIGQYHSASTAYSGPSFDFIPPRRLYGTMIPEEYYLHGSDGNRVQWPGVYYCHYLDIRKPQVRRSILEVAFARAQLLGAQAVNFDNCFFRTAPCAGFPVSAEDWTSACLDFAKEAAEVFRPNIRVVCNVAVGDVYQIPEAMDAYLKYVDGFMTENPFHPDNRNNPTRLASEIAGYQKWAGKKIVLLLVPKTKDGKQDIERTKFALDTIRPIAETTNGRPLTMYGGIYCTSAGKRNQELIDHANL